MKAGNAGSTPDGTSNPENPLSVALDVFLKATGQAVFNLNTIVVGLDSVENGYKKPDSLDISWDPKDKVIAARMARKFSVEAALIYASEAQIEYVSAISALPRFNDLRKKWSAEKSEPSKAKRLSDLYGAIIQDELFLIDAVALMLHWRNRIIHPSSNAKPTYQEKELLRTNDKLIAEKYKNLNVDCLLCHFEEGRPTLKDVSSLISMSVNLSRKVDKQIFSNFRKEDVEAWLDHYKISAELERVRKETSPSKVRDSIKRVFKAHAPTLFTVYDQYFPL